VAGEMNRSATGPAAFRTAAALTGLGLAVQLAASFYWTPLTFIVSAVVGLPLVLLGALGFLRAVLRILAKTGAL
jgi:hypothetical protein